MNNIISSASKIVFILIALTICVSFGFEVMTGRVTLDPKDFLVLAGMAFTFFFAYKGNSDAPYAGK
jgi:hypothetical protein